MFKKMDNTLKDQIAEKPIASKIKVQLALFPKGIASLWLQAVRALFRKGDI